MIYCFIKKIPIKKIILEFVKNKNSITQQQQKLRRESIKAVNKFLHFHKFNKLRIFSKETSWKENETKKHSSIIFCFYLTLTCHKTLSFAHITCWVWGCLRVCRIEWIFFKREFFLHVGKFLKSHNDTNRWRWKWKRRI